MSMPFDEGSKSLLNPRRSVSGQVVAFTAAVDMESMIDTGTGRITLEGHESEGQSIKNKIIVAPNFAFNPDLEFLVFSLAVNEAKPKGMIVQKASSNLVLGAVMADIPLIYGLPDEINDFIKNGDRVKIDFITNEISKNK